MMISLKTIKACSTADVKSNLKINPWSKKINNILNGGSTGTMAASDIMADLTSEKFKCSMLDNEVFQLFEQLIDVDNNFAYCCGRTKHIISSSNVFSKTNNAAAYEMYQSICKGGMYDNCIAKYAKHLKIENLVKHLSRLRFVTDLQANTNVSVGYVGVMCTD